jgi:hypothetical protein
VKYTFVYVLRSCDKISPRLTSVYVPHFMSSSAASLAVAATEKLCPSMARFGNNLSTVIQLWKPIKIRAPKDGESTFYETGSK